MLFFFLERSPACLDDVHHLLEAVPWQGACIATCSSEDNVVCSILSVARAVQHFACFSIVMTDKPEEEVPKDLEEASEEVAVPKRRMAQTDACLPDDMGRERTQNAVVQPLLTGGTVETTYWIFSG